MSHAARPVRRTGLRLAVVTFLAGVLLGVLVPRLFASDHRRPPPSHRLHTVAPGETLWGIAQRVAPAEDARRFVDEVLELNDLERPLIHPGERLILPID